MDKNSLERTRAHEERLAAARRRKTDARRADDRKRHTKILKDAKQQPERPRHATRYHEAVRLKLFASHELPDVRDPA